MTPKEALDLWNESGKGQFFWTFEFAKAIENRALRKAFAIVEKYGLSNDAIALEIRALIDDSE